MEKISHKERDIRYEINHKIGTLNKTRNNKMKQTLRLEKYNESWKFITFFMNVEAVIFVVLSIGAKKDSFFDNSYFTIISSVFSIYVILSQYYINELKYGERALKAHYQQLQIEDLILDLKLLLIADKSNETKISEKEVFENYKKVIEEYQLLLKNNENHSQFDYLMANSSKEIKDSTKDNIMIYLNLFLCIVIPILIVFTLKFS